MREQRRRIHQQPPSPPTSLLTDAGRAREQALRAEPVLPSLQPASPEVTPPAQTSGSQLDRVPSLPPGSPHPYPPDLPAEQQTHVWIQPGTPRWNPGTRLPLQRQGALGGQIAARLGQGTPLQADVRAKLEGGMGTETYLRVQRLATQIIAGADAPDAEDIVRDIFFEGRTESPFSQTMGAHSTAWVAHTDAVRRRLVGRPFDAAIDVLGTMLEETRHYQAYKLLRALDESHRKSLRDAEANLTGLAQKRPRANAPAAQKLSFLQDCISAYLTLVNFVPLATVRGGDTRGHGEPEARQSLIQYEAGELDFDEAVLRTLLWTMFAQDTPRVFARNTRQSESSAWVAALEMFVRTIREAYPKAFNASKISETQHLDAKIQEYVVGPKRTGNVKRGLSKALGGLDAAEERPGSLGSARGDPGQGVAVQIRLNALGQIADIEGIGRTESPFSGTMGAHSTAWAEVTQALIVRLRGKSPDQAAPVLDSMLAEMLRSPGLVFVDSLYPDSARKLVQASTHAIELQKQVQAARGDVERMSLLPSYISAILAYDNLIPLATAEWGDTRGHGEGAVRKALRSGHASGRPSAPSRKRKKQDDNEEFTLPGSRRAKDVPPRLTSTAATLWKLYDPSAAAGFTSQFFDPRDRDRARSELDEAYRQKPLTPLERRFLKFLKNQVSPMDEPEDARAWAVTIDKFLRTVAESQEKAYRGAAFGSRDNVKSLLYHVADLQQDVIDQVLTILTRLGTLPEERKRERTGSDSSERRPSKKRKVEGAEKPPARGEEIDWDAFYKELGL